MVPPGYKLRLGDGTVFGVDENGLLTWLEGGLVDRSARVQPAGSTEWMTVRQLLRWEPPGAPAVAAAPSVAPGRTSADTREGRLVDATLRRAMEEYAAQEAAVEPAIADPLTTPVEDMPVLPLKPQPRPEPGREAKGSWAAVDALTYSEVPPSAFDSFVAGAAPVARRLFLAVANPLVRLATPVMDGLARAAAGAAPYVARRSSDLSAASRRFRERAARRWDAALQAAEALPVVDSAASEAPPVAVVTPVPPAEMPEPMPRPEPVVALPPIPVVALAEPVATPVSASAAEADVPREATPRPRVAPPPTLTEMPVIPFADAPRGPRAEPAPSAPASDTWEPPDEPQSPASPVWGLLVKAGLAAALGGAASLLAVHRDAWLPEAHSRAVQVGARVDEVVSRRIPTPGAQVAATAVMSAAEKIPCLHPDTVARVARASASALPEAHDLFRLAFQAIDRGRPTLAPTAAAEMDGLLDALVGELPGDEAERLRSYLGRIRVRAATVPWEDKEALWLAGRAANRLPVDKLRRLRELTALAVARGLPPALPSA